MNNKKGVLDLRLTREDAARLINDLPKVIKEVSKEEYRRMSGRELKENDYPIKVADVCLAFVKRKGKLVPEFVFVDSPSIEVVIFNIVDTKTLVEIYYKGVKARRKGEMQEELYRAANATLSKDIKVDFNSLVVGILELRKSFDELFEAFKTIVIKDDDQATLNHLDKLATEATKGKLTLRAKNVANHNIRLMLMPTKKESAGNRELFIMLYNENWSYLIKGLYGMSSNHYKSLMQTEDVGELKEKLKNLDLMTLDSLRKSLEYSNRVVTEVSKEYKEEAKQARNKMFEG